MYEAIIIVIYIHLPLQDFTIGYFSSKEKCNSIINEIVVDINENDEAGIIQKAITSGCYNIMGDI